LADLQRTVYPYKWLPISCRSGADQWKFAGQRPTFYHWATQPTGLSFWCSPVPARSCNAESLWLLIQNFLYACLLIDKISCYPQHCLYHLLPIHQTCDNLRAHGHDFELPEFSSIIQKKSFSVSALYMYIRRFCFVFLPEVHLSNCRI